MYLCSTKRKYLTPNELMMMKKKSMCIRETKCEGGYKKAGACVGTV